MSIICLVFGILATRDGDLYKLLELDKDRKVNSHAGAVSVLVVVVSAILIAAEIILIAHILRRDQKVSFAFVIFNKTIINCICSGRKA